MCPKIQLSHNDIKILVEYLNYIYENKIPTSSLPAAEKLNILISKVYDISVRHNERYQDRIEIIKNWNIIAANGIQRSLLEYGNEISRLLSKGYIQ